MAITDNLLHNPAWIRPPGIVYQVKSFHFQFDQVHLCPILPPEQNSIILFTALIRISSALCTPFGLIRLLTSTNIFCKPPLLPAAIRVPHKLPSIRDIESFATWCFCAVFSLVIDVAEQGSTKASASINPVRAAIVLPLRLSVVWKSSKSH